MQDLALILAELHEVCMGLLNKPVHLPLIASLPSSVLTIPQFGVISSGPIDLCTYMLSDLILSYSRWLLLLQP